MSKNSYTQREQTHTAWRKKSSICLHTPARFHLLAFKGSPGLLAAVEKKGNAPQELGWLQQTRTEGPQTKLNCKWSNRFSVCYAKLSKQPPLVLRPRAILPEAIPGEGGSSRRGPECCSGLPLCPQQLRESQGPRLQLGFLWGSDWEHRHPHSSVWCNSVSLGARPWQKSQVAIFVFRNASLLILASYDHFSWTLPTLSSPIPQTPGGSQPSPFPGCPVLRIFLRKHPEEQ